VAWFPDGSRLLANLEVAGKPPSIWILSLIGYAPRKFRDDGYAQSISPDGERIVFTSASSGLSEHEQHRMFGDHTIWLAEMNGQPPKKITESDDSTGFTKAVWSPDTAVELLTSQFTRFRALRVLSNAPSKIATCREGRPCW
jgi:Tol biopolymer transport system component